MRNSEQERAKEKQNLEDVSKKGVNELVRRVNYKKNVRVNSNKAIEEIDASSKKRNGGDVDDDDDDGVDWEDGSNSKDGSNSILDCAAKSNLVIEFSSESSDSVKRKPVRRTTAEEKEVAELVHRVHLLCLLARGRVVDTACDDPLIQASLLSLLPSHLLDVSGLSNLSAKDLFPLVSWFHNNFHVRSSLEDRRPFHSALAFALETHEGTLEEIAALSVALFRALKLTTRFVSILDVASIKPDADKCESSIQDTSKVRGGLFNTSTLMVDKPKEVSASPFKSFSTNGKNNVCETPLGDSVTEMENLTAGSGSNDISTSQGSKRKGDLEFEMQLKMALSATAFETSQIRTRSDAGSSISDLSNISSPLKRIKTVGNEGSPSHGISTAVGSRKIGSPLHWAEVYCSGENLTGKWVHIDAVNAIVDGEQKVEAAAASCKTTLRYVVAFAGHGAKDVTRRYCMKWHKIASQRTTSIWWDAVLGPLRELESGATGEAVHFEKHHLNTSNGLDNVKASGVSAIQNDFATRTSLEDMELETRALTEPLPTNQQAYRNHQLYAIERWLTKFQMLHPKGPVLGFCSGHAVYPRACVQTLKTKQRWLREGLQVKTNETPAKIWKQTVKLKKVKSLEEDEYGETDSKGNIELYGKWQVEPLQLPHAVNGVVPKNDRGQVDVWSEKCLPPGTVHIKLPRVFHVAKRLEIDYAPAMVGFEFKNGRSVPVFEGIVVCTEFKDAILEAYAEEREIREAEEKRRNEAQALSRWYQLLSSMITRQRLNNSYGKGQESETPSSIQDKNNELEVHVRDEPRKQSPRRRKKNQQETKPNVPSAILTEDHEHIFLVEDQTFDEESLVKTKRCHCGFSVQVEEL